MPPRSPRVAARSTSWWRAGAAILAGTVLAPATVQTWLSQDVFATAFMSPPTYVALLEWLGLAAGEQVGASLLYDVSWTTAAALVFAILPVSGVLGSLVLFGLGRSQDKPQAISRWLCVLGLGGVGIGLWEWCWLPAVLLGGESGAALMAGLVPFWTATAAAAVLTAFLGLCAAGSEPAPQATPIAEPEPQSWARATTWQIAGLVALYSVVFIAMNWRLWFNLLLPHGDSAMYEEHLWNVLHGKGFRSYLDQGLFLGEHIQFVHLGLIPLYILWPSHLLLEACESLALACGGFPVAWMTWRHTGSRFAALCAVAAYLLYAPLQFLDIEIDLKTFRPEAFGIPLLLLALDQLDRGRWLSFLGLLAACLTVKEDYAIIVSPLGLWIAATAWGNRKTLRADAWRISGRRWLVTGLGLCVFGVCYLWLATRVLMPYFRPGQDIHYASYFSRLGESPEAIVLTVLTRPGFVAGEVLTLSTLLYLLALLAPVGGLALLSPGRLAVGLPLFGILCLNELARDPRHQFHAPLVAIVFWATAAGLGNLPDIGVWLSRRRRRIPPLLKPSVASAARWLWTSSLATGVFFSLSPLGLSFWDTGSNWYWRKLYGASPRGAAIAKIEPLIPRSARVASTDFVHPRFTHHERSYDYSGYLRKVSGYEQRVPDDADYIVIDATHPYSQYHVPADVPEFHEAETWELLPDETGGVFIVLKRRAH